MAYDCSDKKNRMSNEALEGLNRIPLLRYQKDPVLHIEDLYIKYPQGGGLGWYAFVLSDKTFAYWDIEIKSWEFVSSGDLQSLLGVDVSDLKEGDVPVWDETQGKFVIVNSDMWGSVEW